ncbi:MAG: DUF3159 domain-containing protein [Tropheryma whipplei]|uniref:DUF3159 domain-containing protein n=1 Tax=Tropheryma whipplei (strain Twist) TaxID=203267 RepID=Q83G45_TROWT|nr:DUF3159 domain-containing protein [Tropheryma whipplei]AAO44582.1 unknown [Tropheryma whipplei str. Twist]MCO8182994.1 DUF3159 domain-containing protein [Tropheryma whipplei]MCO8190021.1 DUF3159 domain-containing protein [Tropheryma whipplei]CAD66953.1 putative integral membrane protein [Tropheryma whipplei TW08/27]
MRFSDFSELLAGISGKRSGGRTGFSNILSVLGGVRGVVESLLPPLVYILTFSILKDLLLACIISVLLSLFIVSLRIAKRQSLVPAFSGFFGFVISVLVSLYTGRAIDVFVIGIVWNAVLALLLLVSVLLRMPVFGFLLAGLLGDLGWRKDPNRVWAYSVITIVFFAASLLRAVIQLPLYLSGNFELLATTKIFMGYPLLGLTVFTSWVLFRKINSKSK